MRKINKLVIHCSDSEFGNANLIRKWHTDPESKGGKGFDDIGYQYVICNGQIEPDVYRGFMDGAIECGRPECRVGAHVKGHNSDSIGICLISKDGNPTIKQMNSLTLVIETLKTKYQIPVDRVFGHYELDHKKTCPNFDMVKYRSTL